MRDIPERTRISKAELFVTDMMFDMIADLSDDAYYRETDAEGLIAGLFYRDVLGVYGVASGLIPAMSGIHEAIGWFRTSPDGTSMSQRDIARHVGLFGRDKAFAIMVDNVASSFAIYAVEDGIPRKVQAAVLEC